MITHGFLPQHELLRALGIFAALRDEIKDFAFAVTKFGNACGGVAGRALLKNSISRMVIAGLKMASPLPTARMAHRISEWFAPFSR